MDSPHYIIRGGIEGRERLRILARVMQPSTLSLLQRTGVRPGMKCLEVGCGGGDLAFDLARMVGAEGWVVATDIDQTKLDLGRSEATAQNLSNIEFKLQDIARAPNLEQNQFDLVHARFVLTHLPNPGLALERMRAALRPDGIVVIEDIDFRGYFCHPDSAALWRYVELYTEAVRRRGGDANIGPRLPSLVAEAGFADVQMNIVQPAGTSGDVKLLSPLTMENIADVVVAEGLASAVEIAQIVEALYEYARSPGSIGCTPRVVQVWARKD